MPKGAKMEEKKKLSKEFIIFACILSAILLFFIIFIVSIIIGYKEDYPGVRTDFASIEEFEECKGYVTKEIPEGASDVRFYLNRTPLEYESIYSFVISDEEEFDAYMEKYCFCRFSDNINIY